MYLYAEGHRQGSEEQNWPSSYSSFLQEHNIRRRQVAHATGPSSRSRWYPLLRERERLVLASMIKLYGEDFSGDIGQSIHRVPQFIWKDRRVFCPTLLPHSFLWIAYD